MENDTLEILTSPNVKELVAGYQTQVHLNVISQFCLAPNEVFLSVAISQNFMFQ